MSFPLDAIEVVAQQVWDQLAPYCAPRPTDAKAPACVIAGSIRRRRAQCNDIDIVAIPKLETVKTGLFSEGAREPLTSSEFYRVLITQVLEGVRGKMMRGYVRSTMGVSGTWKRPPVPCDVYIATPETWATLLLIRTGSAAHNVFLCTRARDLGGMLHADGSGLDFPGDYDPVTQRSGPRRRLVPQTEAEIFAAIVGADLRVAQAGRAEALPLHNAGIPPELRECNQRRVPVWMEQISHGGTEAQR